MEVLMPSAKRHRDAPLGPLPLLGSTPYRRRLSRQQEGAIPTLSADDIGGENAENLHANPMGGGDGGWFASTRGAIDPEDPWSLGSDGQGVVVQAHGPLLQCDTGQSCGVWFVCDRRGSPCGVFKPAIEEHVPEEFAHALTAGENMHREHAAYVISRELALCSVPATVVARLRSPSLLGGGQRGSLQRFVADAFDMTDLGPSHIRDEEVHKIGMLDLLLLNLDRHEGNMLMKKAPDGSRTIIPIDHGLSLPLLVSPNHAPDTRLLEQLSFVWQGWQHASRPFSAASRALAAALTQRRVRALARAVSAAAPGISSESLTTLEIGGVVLRMCVGAGMSLRETAAFVQQGLGKALEHAHGACEGGEGVKHGQWELAFLAKLEEAVRKMVAGGGGGEWELCADLADAQFE